MGFIFAHPSLFLGLLLVLCLENMFVMEWFWNDGSLPFSLSVTLYPSCSGAALLAIALLARKKTLPFARAEHYTAVTVFLAISLFALAGSDLFPNQQPFPTVAILSVCFCAIALSAAMVSWLLLYVRMPMKTTLACLALAYSGSFLLSPLFATLHPRWIIICLMGGGALLSAKSFKAADVLLSEPALEEERNSLTAESRKRAPFPFRPIVATGVLYAVTTFVQSLSAADAVLFMDAPGALLALCLVAALATRSGLVFMDLQHVSLLLAVSALLCVPLSNSWAMPASIALSLCASIVFLVFSETLLCGICQRYSANAPWLLSLSLFALIPGSFLGITACELLREFATSQNSETVLSSALIIIVLALFLIFITESDVLNAWGMKSLDNDEIPLEHDLKIRAFELSCQYGFTKREEEICELLAQGNNVADIAQLLVLSPATIKTHMAHIYKKMGVHSIQQFRTVFFDR